MATATQTRTREMQECIDNCTRCYATCGDDCLLPGAGRTTRRSESCAAVGGLCTDLCDERRLDGARLRPPRGSVTSAPRFARAAPRTASGWPTT